MRTYLRDESLPIVSPLRLDMDFFARSAVGFLVTGAADLLLFESSPRLAPLVVEKSFFFVDFLILLDFVFGPSYVRRNVYE